MLRQTKLITRVLTLLRDRISVAGSINFKISIVLYLLAFLAIAAGPVGAQSSNSDYVAGIQSYFQGNFNTCLRTLDSVVRLVPLTKDELCEARTFMGASHLQLGDSVSARSEFEQAIRLVPDYVIGLDFTPVIRQFYIALRDRTFVSLLIDSEPSGVALSIDGRPVGQTPFRKDSVFAGGTFEVGFTPDPCYRTLETEIEAVEGRSNKHMFRLGRVFCPLSINLTPEDARYVIEDSTGQRVRWQDSVPCGQQWVARLTRDGFWNMTVPVECLTSGSAHLEAIMKNRSRPATGAWKYVTGGLSILLFIRAEDADREAEEMRALLHQAEDPIDREQYQKDFDLQRKVRRYSKAAGVGFGAVSIYLWARYIFGSSSKPNSVSDQPGLSIRPHEEMPGIQVSVGL